MRTHNAASCGSPCHPFLPQYALCALLHAHGSSKSLCCATGVGTGACAAHRPQAVLPGCLLRPKRCQGGLQQDHSPSGQCRQRRGCYTPPPYPKGNRQPRQVLLKRSCQPSLCCGNGKRMPNRSACLLRRRHAVYRPKTEKGPIVRQALLGL